MVTLCITSKPPHQHNGHGNHRQQAISPAQWTNDNNGWWPAGQWTCHDIQTVTTHVVVTIHKFRWAPWLPSPPLFTWEPRGHITDGDMATNFRFPFANNITHPWSVPHVAVASLCLQGNNGFFYLIYIQSSTGLCYTTTECYTFVSWITFAILNLLSLNKFYLELLDILSQIKFCVHRMSIEYAVICSKLGT